MYPYTDTHRWISDLGAAPVRFDLTLGAFTRRHWMLGNPVRILSDKI